MQKTPPYILPVIVLAQFAGTSTWFAGNAILPGIQQQFRLPASLLGNMTVAVQLGFISGTLLFAILMLADRFSPVKLFLVSSLAAALFNQLVIYANGSIPLLLAFRFMTGCSLAGVYPIGMKIAADWFAGKLGKALGLLVGALVAGTALPYLVRSGSYELPWQQVVTFTSLFAATGGLLVGIFVKDGPFRIKGSGFQLSVFRSLFRAPKFSAAARGYFGHMWELYTLWAFTPALLSLYNEKHGTTLPVALTSFFIIAAGSIGCMAGGILAQKKGSAAIAFVALAGSGFFCLLLPLLFLAPPVVFISGMLCWGTLAAADSPQFSALVAGNAEQTHKGTALTLVTSIGFAITIVSIRLMNELWFSLTTSHYQQWLFLLLVPGPVSGLLSMKSLFARKDKA
ncbi:MFS transporter [Sediminibacterium ginsengisoli]|uniref:Predicted arabinose efflux permease, MFS family n=1 Tax=Sediminibacterium ginsengisoli TaxID=413434 RepID=A0A1T4P480_9BACT|nr:MFS transporter [Sediminibacterium ginsengisoli]SJZ86259.1 Predicted arabinose efflux permease, MFS family [Sediminibacterium ginsengisoli]